MRLLLDTHVLLRALTEPARISADVRDLIELPTNIVIFSAASIWEIAIKAAIGRKDFAYDAREIADAARTTGFRESPVDAATAATVASLPMHHRDPFDRLLVAQAMCGLSRLVTADRRLTAYSESTLLLRS